MSDLPTDIAAARGVTRRESVGGRADVPAALVPEAAYPVPAVQAFCGVGRSTIYRAMSTSASYRGALPYLPSFTIGGRRVIRGRAVLAWLDALEAQSKA